LSDALLLRVPQAKAGSAVAATPAIVLGSGVGALGALRRLRHAGIPAYALPAAPMYESRSRWLRALPGARGTLAAGTALATLLEGSGLARAVLVPTSDALLRAVCELPPPLAARFPSSTPTLEVALQLADKARFAHLLERLAVPAPRTLVAPAADTLARFAGDGFEHLFIKPADSASFMRRYGVKGCRVRDLKDGCAQLQRLQADGVSVIAQEYVPGPASAHYLLDGFAGAGGQVEALFARRRLRMYPPDFGNSSYMVSVPLDAVEGAARSLRRILAAIGYRGIFSAEFKRDARDGQFKVLEINARVWVYVEFAARCGVDVCLMAYRDALGLPAPRPPRYRSGARLVSPEIDIAAAYHAWSQGELSLLGWARSWLGAQQPLFNWTDPRPAVSEWLALLGRIVRRLLRGPPAP
jgi:predicted ATP-grasp superfamily ATP-dependent carboligase